MTLVLRKQRAQDRIKGRELLDWGENDNAVIDEIGRIYRAAPPNQGIADTLDEAKAASDLPCVRCAHHRDSDGSSIPRSNRCDRTVRSLISAHQCILTELFGHLEEEDTMFTKAALGLAIILATASGTLAAPKSHSVALSRDAYLSYNRDAAYLGTDPDRKIQFELNRDRTHRVGQ